MAYYRRQQRRERGRSVPVTIGALAALVLIVIVASLMTCSRASQPPSGTLVVGTSTDFPPFEKRFGREVRGFDMDLCAMIAQDMGREVVIRDFAFDALLPSLGSGSHGEDPLVDIVCSAMTITEAREEVADFSESYFDANQAVLASSESGFSYSSPNDLSGLVVAYQEGTTSQTWFEENVMGKVNVAEGVPFENIGISLQRLGRDYDVMIVDGPVADSFVKSRDDVIISGMIETSEQYGFAVAEGDPQGILEHADKVLAEIKENSQEKKHKFSYDELVEKWFGGGES